VAGIYLHIPFCKQACHYCDFHFSTSLKNKQAFLDALKLEIALQKNYLKGQEIKSVYLGGGTPSLLSQRELLDVFQELNENYSISADAEITLEANPDDLTHEKLRQLKETPVNRLSIGLQSFAEKDLRYMNRAHTAEMGSAAVKDAQDAGFNNISVDLIYGTPTLSKDVWLNNLDKVFALQVKHISCYALTVEPKTALDRFIRSGKSENPDERQTAYQFETLIAEMKKNDFIQYEISNFCKEGFLSKHNSNYWLKEHYLGLGPSAHSYNGYSRQWNVRNNNRYIRALEKRTLDFEKEILKPDQHYNEYILTSLRTIWGTDLDCIRKMGEDYYTTCVKEVQRYIMSGDVIQKNSLLNLTDKGKLLADKIASDLFVV